MSVEEYDRKRAAELDLALKEVQEDISKGRYTTSVQDHLKEIQEVIDS